MNAAMPLVKDVISIFKLRIGVTIMMSAIGGVAVTPGPLPELWRVALLGLAVFLASASAGAFNQWAEADLDGQMKRTANRPFATGRLKANGAWLAAILGLSGLRGGLGLRRKQCLGRLSHLHGRLRLWHRLHRLAQAPQLDQHRGRWCCRKLCGSGGCGGG